MAYVEVEWERYPQEIIKARIKDGFLDGARIFSHISPFANPAIKDLPILWLAKLVLANAAMLQQPRL